MECGVMVNKIQGSNFEQTHSLHESNTTNTNSTSTKQAFGHQWSAIRVISGLVDRIHVQIMNFFANLNNTHEPYETPSFIQSRTDEIAQLINRKDIDSDSKLEMLKIELENLTDTLDTHVGYPKNVINTIQGSISSIQNKIKEIESEKLRTTQFEMAISNSSSTEAIEELHLVYELTERGFESIASNKERKTTKDYLVQLDDLAHIKEQVQNYASTFDNSFPEIHKIVQKAMKELESKIKELEIEMCKKIKEKFKPDPRTPGDGSCMFWSIAKLHPEHKSQEYYREKASQYLIDHPPEFPLEFSEQMMNYERSQGGREEWALKLEKKLGHQPSEEEFYGDALVNSKNPIWGGAVETMALSKALQVPILTFTANKDGKTWRLDIAQGQSEFKDKEPILLYYNGGSHYQSLIPR